MQHKCEYFLTDTSGNLVCSVCKTPSAKSHIEDKMSPAPENKAAAAVKSRPAAKKH